MFGAFTRKLRQFVLDEGIIALPFAIRSMTGLAADFLNGCIEPTRVVHCACGSEDEHEPGAHGRPGRTAAEWAVVEAEEHDRH